MLWQQRPALTGAFRFSGSGVHGEVRMPTVLKAPFPYFGGKARVAGLIWDRLGDVDNYCEPFCGSAAVLLARPHRPRIETVNDPALDLPNFWRSTHPKHGDPAAVAEAVCEVINDADPYLANVWRSLQADPEETAAWADHPVCENYLHTVHRWLVQGEEAEAFRERMRADPDFCDPRRAGRWLFGICCWIGGGWCARGTTEEQRLCQKRPRISGPGQGTKYGDGVHAKGPTAGGRPQLADAYSLGRGVHAGPAGGQIPHLSHGNHPGDVPGKGVHAGPPGTCEQRRLWLLDWFGRLRDRLRNVRVCCGDWARICSSESTTTRLGLTGVFLDPPYSLESKRATGLYAQDSLTVAHDVRRWCLEHGGNPQIRIALSGYADEGHEELEQHGWECVAWEASGGYGNRTEQGKANARKERLWFNPSCQREKTLFDGLPAAVTDTGEEP